MKKWLFLLLCLFLSSASAEVYKWMDEDGNVHYSDRSPEEDSEPLELPKGVYYTPPALVAGSEQDEAPVPAKRPVGYETLVITKPAMNETVYSNQGLVTVQLSVEPALASGHEFKFTFDGRPLQERYTDTTVVLNNIERGSHTLKVQVMDGETVVETSKSVVFHLRKESIYDPNSGSSGDNSTAFTPDYNADSSSGTEFDASETPNYDEGVSTDGSDYSNVDPNDSSKSVYDSATTKIPSTSGGSQYNPGSSYTPNYNQKK
jgi:hypothetical protein